jgi:hypothetical protein
MEWEKDIVWKLKVKGSSAGAWGSVWISCAVEGTYSVVPFCRS